MNLQSVEDNIQNQLVLPKVEMEQVKIKVNDGIQNQSMVKIELLEIKEELIETFPVKYETWDGSEIKSDPKVEITTEENIVELPKEIADCTLADMLNSPFLVIQAKGDGDTSAVSHNTASSDSGKKLIVDVKSLLLDYKLPTAHQYSGDIVKKRLCKKRQTSALQITGIQMIKEEANKQNKPLLQYENLNSAEQTLMCETIKYNSCDSCNKCFSTLGRLKRHMRIHADTKPYTCETCLQCFTTKTYLKIHYRIHTGSKPYTCDTCHKCFSQRSNLITHFKQHTVGKSYTCEICHKCFTTESAFNLHTELHTGSKPYTCNECQKSFSLLSYLKKHMKIHMGRKPYICVSCHASFITVSSLKRHIMIHTGSKPYTCETCLKCFNTQSGLKTHIRIHTGSKPYTCGTCHKCFSQPSSLKTHFRVHTGIKPYTCQICHKSFTTLQSLKTHVRIHTEGNR